MKELSIEEKAKAYDKALKQGKQLKWANPYDTVGDMIDSIFPELKESEDGKIRKELVTFVKGMLECHDKPNAERDEKYESWLAWLEKQGEKESDPRKCILDELLVADNIYQMSMNDAMVEEAKAKAIIALSNLEISKLLGFEKQGEQKIETDYIKLLLDDIISIAERTTSGNVSHNIATIKCNAKKIIDSLEKQGEEETKPLKGNWYMCINDYQFCEHDSLDFEKGKLYKSEKDGELTASDGGKWPFRDIKNFFRKATHEEVEHCLLEKYGEQKPAEWSEEDEHIISKIIDKLSRFQMIVVGSESECCSELIEWLKSLRPQTKQE